MSNPATPPNRLQSEASPYLRMHAANPVDWFPWGPEAFAKAERENKPIFLSVGYYTCHWCHVMERESFADAGIAELLNRSFVSIKVDREERPDVDRFYMSFVQATSGGGGWPMSVFLTPDRKPFFGGTYFPPEDRHGRPGFATVLRSLAHTWAREPERVRSAAGEITSTLANYLRPQPPEPGALDTSILDELYRRLLAGFDALYGGFGAAPKFPRPAAFGFLLRYALRAPDSGALKMTEQTLHAMGRGGIYDQLGGGFHRYSTDAVWLVPHFEKMLYDQAQIVVSLIETYQATGAPWCAELARATLAYVLREMTSPEGGFYSAQDADSPMPEKPDEHAEGAFYVWTEAEMEAILGADLAPLAVFYFGVRPQGNVPAAQDPQGELSGKNVLSAAATLAEAAARFGRGEEETATKLAEIHRKLFAARSRRPAPPLDDKVLAAWNGLMISAFARAGAALGETRYLAAANAAAAFVREQLWDGQRRRLRRRFHRSGAAAASVAVDGMAEDYAFLIAGLLDLFEAEGEPDRLAWALELQRQQDALFWAENGGYYSVAEDADGELLVRQREDYDGAEPSPNSIAVMNLLRLSALTGEADFRRRAETTLQSFGTRLRTLPDAVPALAAALDAWLTAPRQIVVTGNPESAAVRELWQEARRRFLPFHLRVLAGAGERRARLNALIPWLPELPSDETPAAYVCEDFTCQLPAHSTAELAARLDKSRA